MRRKPLALIDIDGVLANDTARLPFAEQKNWVEYFDPSRMALDTVYAEGRAMVRDLKNDGWRIGYLTGRREDRRDVTKWWLRANNFPWGPLYMRPRGVNLRLAEFKVEVMRSLRTRYTEIHLHDDDPEVVRAVREAFGADAAYHCTWYIKPESLVRRAAA